MRPLMKRNNESTLTRGFFDDFMRDFGGLAEFDSTKLDQFTPKVDIQENDESYMLHFEMPGIKQDDINIEYKDNMLSVYGERKWENEEKKDEYHRKEMSCGKFSRSFRLDKDVNKDKIQAKMKDGILDINLPKAITKETTKRINIDSY